MNQWFDNPGRAPARWPADTKIECIWANGEPARHAYMISQLVWERRGWPFDVARFRKQK